MFSGKKLLLLGFIIILLIAIPITIYLVQQQQQTKSKAAPATILSVVDSETSSATKTMNVGETATFKVIVNPGTNQVSFVKFTLTYDPTKLEVNSGDFKPNENTFRSVLQGPTYASGTVSVTLSIGGSLDNIIKTPTEAGTITVKAVASTQGGTTKIDFGTPQVLSVGSTDTFNENVFSSSNPAIITIGGEDTTTTTLPEETTTTSAGDTNSSPTCESLTLDDEATGTAPYTLMFTATGSDSDGIIDKVTFNFGDGQVQDVTEGTGEENISAQLSHTYDTAGSFTATAVMTDDEGGVSNTSSCTQSITINGEGGGTSTSGGGTSEETTTGETTQQAVAPTATPTMVPSGPGNTIITYGAIGAALSIVGVLLLFAL